MFRDLKEIFTGIFAILFIIVLVIEIVSYWRVFKKSGEKSWKAIVPVYNRYVAFKLSWRPLFFYISLPFIPLFIYGFAVAWLWLFDVDYQSFFIAVVVLLASAAVLIVLGAVCRAKLAFRFGKSGLFALGMVLAPPVFLMLLAFGRAEYRPRTVAGQDEAGIAAGK